MRFCGLFASALIAPFARAAAETSALAAQGTPNHPEYPSGHSTVSGSAAFILAAAFGDATPFTVTSDVRPGTRAFPSFSDAVAEIADARVFGGIHFRTSCVRANLLGQAVADYVSTHAMLALGGD